jgi:DNA-binding transcriptional MerR regulator
VADPTSHDTRAPVLPASAVSGDVGALAEHCYLTTGDMARLSKSTLRTVRFYDEEGILRPVERTDGGHRLFEHSELARLLLVIDLRAAGLSLGDIKALLDLKRGAPTGGDAARIATRVLAERVEELDEKLAVLSRLRSDLLQTAEVVAGCRTCAGHEFFPTDCDRCSIVASHERPPRALCVLWSVGSKRDKADGSARIEERE